MKIIKRIIRLIKLHYEDKKIWDAKMSEPLVARIATKR